VLEKAHRLENKANAKLLRKLRKGYEKSGGASILFEHKKLEELCAMVAKALHGSISASGWERDSRPLRRFL